jgi:hypothetical protein
MCGAAFVPVAAISNLPVGLVVPIPTRSELSIVIAVASELSDTPVLNKPLEIFVNAILVS